MREQMEDLRNNITTQSTPPSSLQPRVHTAVNPAELVREKPSPQATLRRFEYALVVLGTGILAFGGWSIIKMVLLILLQDEEAQRKAFLIDPSDSLILFYIALAIVMCFDLLIRFYVFKSARKESFGGKPRNGYLVVTALMLLLSGASIIVIILNIPALDENTFDSFVSLIIETTSFVIQGMLIYSAVQVRALRKEME